MDRLLVIIVTYNAMQWAERCFDSLRKSTVKVDVFVVDNGSTDGTQAYLQEHYPEVMFNQSKENLGFGKANNLGLQYALDKNYDYVYLLNQDAWVMEDTFERLIEISKSHSDYGVLSPFQMNADMVHIDRNFIVNVMRWDSNPDIISDLYNRNLKDVYSVTEVMAAHWFMTRECLLKVGGFSPSFPHYHEDNNFIDRMFFYGLKIGITPSLKVVHDRGWREDTDKRKMLLQYTGAISEMSKPSPLGSNFKILIKLLYGELKSIVTYKSILPLFYAWKLICHKHTISNNLRISITEQRAFLTKEIE